MWTFLKLITYNCKKIYNAVPKGLFSQKFLQTSYDQNFGWSALLIKWRGLFRVNLVKLGHLRLRYDRKIIINCFVNTPPEAQTVKMCTFLKLITYNCKNVYNTVPRGLFSQKFLQISYDQTFGWSALFIKWRVLFKFNLVKLWHPRLRYDRKIIVNC